MNDKPIDDGGPAFPHDSQGFHYLGMTLRDYFAAAVLQGMLSDNRCNDTAENFSDIAYKFADVMLERRKR
jgi:hypothetical protein